MKRLSITLLVIFLSVGVMAQPVPGNYKKPKGKGDAAIDTTKRSFTMHEVDSKTVDSAALRMQQVQNYVNAINAITSDIKATLRNSKEVNDDEYGVLIKLIGVYIKEKQNQLYPNKK